jgi:hypothetical protein
LAEVSSDELLLRTSIDQVQFTLSDGWRRRSKEPRDGAFLHARNITCEYYYYTLDGQTTGSSAVIDFGVYYADSIGELGGLSLWHGYELDSEA